MIFFTVNIFMNCYPQYPLRTLIPALMIALAACGEAPINQQAQAASPAKTSKMVSAAQTVPADVVKTITTVLEKNYADQNLSVKSIHGTPIAGMYEVLVDNRQIVYSDASGKHMIVGDLIRTDDQVSLTAERQAELNKINFSDLPLEKAIKEVRGKGEHTVVVFSDPDCPFCKRLELEFAKMDNVTIYNFMMPILSLHPNAYEKAVQIWCQPNRTQAWNNWMRNKQLPPKVKECSNPVAETVALGAEYGFNGTPTMVFPNGKIHSGYAMMPQLATLIQQNQN